MASGYSAETWRHTPAIHSDTVHEPGVILNRIYQTNEQGKIPLSINLDRTQPTRLRGSLEDGTIDVDRIVVTQARSMNKASKSSDKTHRRSHSHKPRVSHAGCSISKADHEAEMEQEYVGVDGNVMPGWDSTVALDTVENPYRHASLRTYFGQDTKAAMRSKFIYLKERVPSGIKYVTAFEEQGLDLSGLGTSDPTARVVTGAGSSTSRAIVTTGPKVLKLAHRGLRDTVLTPEAIDIYDPKSYRIENDDKDDCADAMGLVEEVGDQLDDLDAAACATSRSKSCLRAKTQILKRPAVSQLVASNPQDAEFNYRSAAAVAVTNQTVITSKSGGSLTLAALGLHLNHRDFISDTEVDSKGVESAVWIWRRNEGNPEQATGWGRVRIDLELLKQHIITQESENNGAVDFSVALEAATTKVEDPKSALGQQHRNPTKVCATRPKWCFDYHYLPSRKNPYVHPSRRVFFSSAPAPPQRLPVSTPVRIDPHVFTFKHQATSQDGTKPLAATAPTPSLTEIPQDLQGSGESGQGVIVEKLSKAFVPPIVGDVQYSASSVPAVIASQLGYRRNVHAAVAALAEKNRSAFSGGNTLTSTSASVTTPEEFLKKAAGTWKHPLTLRPDSIDSTFTQSHSGFSPLLGKPLKGPYAPGPGEISYAERQEIQAAESLVKLPSNLSSHDAHLQFTQALTEAQDTEALPQHQPAVASMLLKERGWVGPQSSTPGGVNDSTGVAAAAAKQAATGRVVSLDGRTTLPKVGGLSRSEALMLQSTQAVSNGATKAGSTQSAAMLSLRGSGQYVDEVSYEFTEADGAAASSFALASARQGGKPGDETNRTSVQPATSRLNKKRQRQQAHILAEQSWNDGFSTLRSAVNEKIYKNQREYFDRQQALADQRTYLDVTLRERAKIDLTLHAKAPDSHLGLPIEQDLSKEKKKQAEENSLDSTQSMKQTQLPGDPYAKFKSGLFNVMSYLEPPDEFRHSVAVAVDKGLKPIGANTNPQAKHVLRDTRTEVKTLGDQALQASLEARLIPPTARQTTSTAGSQSQETQQSRNLRRQQRLVTLERAARAQRELGWNPHHHVRRSVVNQNLYKTQRDLLSAPKEEDRFEFEALDGTSKDILQTEQQEYVLNDVWDRFNDLVTKRMLRRAAPR